MTAEHQRLIERANGRDCYELAIAELRRRVVVDCRGEPLRPAEIEAALRRAASH